MKNYKVIKEFWMGGKREVGETFAANPSDVAHLIGSRIKLMKPKKTEDDDS